MFYSLFCSQDQTSLAIFFDTSAFRFVSVTCIRLSFGRNIIYGYTILNTSCINQAFSEITQ